jgi:hypothetical protein
MAKSHEIVPHLANNLIITDELNLAAHGCGRTANYVYDTRARADLIERATRWHPTRGDTRKRN